MTNIKLYKMEEAKLFMHKNEIDIIIYHNNCHDGQTAAAIAYISLNVKNAKKVEYIAKNPGDLDPDYVQKYHGKNILLLDISWKLEDYLKVLDSANKVLILDHHKSALNDLGKVDRKNGMCLFDLKESGASMSWYYFNDSLNDDALPLFVKYVKDRDIWEWKYRGESEAMYYGLCDIHKKYKNEFEEYCKYIEDDSKLDDLIKIGKNVMDNIKNEIEIKASEAKIGNLYLERNYKVCYMSMIDSKLPVSEMSEYLYTKNNVDIVMTWFQPRNFDNLYTTVMSTIFNNEYCVSMRSNKKDVDLSQIATHFGGGGHASAAGFRLKKNPETLFKKSNRNEYIGIGVMGIGVMGLFGFFILKKFKS